MKSFGQKLTGRTTRVIGIVAAILILTAIIALLIFVPQWQAGHIADDATRLEREDNARRTLAQIIGGTVGLVIIYITWQRLQVAREELRVAREGQVTERFSRAIEHLGNNSLDVRLGAIYALERIARDSRQDHGAIMEILTAYVREHAPWGPPPEDQQPAADERPLATDIQAALTVIGRRKTDYDPPWEGLDLRYTDLRGANLTDANLQGANLIWANFRGVLFKNANLQGAHLNETILREADLTKANLQGAFLTGAKSEGTYLTRADLQGAHLVGTILEGADLTGADLQGTYLNEANLQIAYLTGANFAEADLRGSGPQRGNRTYLSAA